MNGPDQPELGEGVQYRRGALMGFTVAESFMLISFALLLLLALWRSVDAEQERAERSLSRLTETQRVQIVAAADDGTLDARLALSSEQARATAAEAVILPADAHRLLEERARLVAEADIRALAEAAADLPPDQLRQLTDLVRLEDYRDLLERLESLKGIAAIDDPAAIEEMRRLAADPDAIAKLDAVKQMERDGLSDDDLRAALHLAREARAGRLVAGGVEREAAERIRARTGALVAEMGGEITETGDVILPDALLFSRGSARIEPPMANFLRGFCRPWFEILHDLGPQLATVQIEGHASSEFGALPPAAAYLENLRLSQERARAVFTFCLREVGDDEIGRWARQRLAAIGYSSARRIVVDGEEDRVRSRRVVFNIDADEPSLFDALRRGDESVAE